MTCRAAGGRSGRRKSVRIAYLTHFIGFSLTRLNGRNYTEWTTIIPRLSAGDEETLGHSLNRLAWRTHLVPQRGARRLSQHF